MRFGASVAENEREELGNYFVATYQWKKILNGEIDVVYGPKGSGKSAMYLLLDRNKKSLETRNIFYLAAVNYVGTPAFYGLKEILNQNAESLIQPAKLESELRFIWKLYFVCLICQQLKSSKLKHKKLKDITQLVESANLIPKKASFESTLKSVVGFLKKMKLKDSEVGFPSGIKITFEDASLDELTSGFNSPHGLLKNLNDALEELGKSVWIGIDRLDVAFSGGDDHELEIRALRALFRTYLDISGLRQIKLKIFLRDDVWERIMDYEFPEASHIERHTTLKWNKESLIFLIVKRLLSNAELCAHYQVEEAPLYQSSNNRLALFYRIFPEKIGRQRTLDWIFSRIMDGNQLMTPRELIHLLNEARDQQSHMQQIGVGLTNNNKLISSEAFVRAMPEVSKVRLQRTLFAENANLKFAILALKEDKITHCIETLCQLWNREASEAQEIVDELLSVGFFSKVKFKGKIRYKVPYLYQSELKLTRGTNCPD